MRHRQRRALLRGLAAVSLAAFVPEGARALALAQDRPRRIGTTAGPHAEILAHVAGLAGLAGVPLHLQLRDGGLGLNSALVRGELDAVCFQDGVGFAADNQRLGGALVNVASTVTLPMGLYSRRLRSPKQLRQGDRIALPEEAAELARALVLLQNYGLLTLRDGSGLRAGLRDINGNWRGLRFELLPGARLFAALPTVALAVIGSAQATQAGLEPGRDSIGIEDARSPWAGVLAVRRADAGQPWVVRLVALYRSEDTKRFVLERFHDAVRRPW